MSFFLWPISILTVISAVVFLFITNFLPPQNKDSQIITINLVYFFLSGFVSLAGGLTLVLYWLRSLKLKRQRSREADGNNYQKQVLKSSARQAIIFSAAVVGILLLKIFNFANPLNVVLLSAAAIAIEVYFFGH
jgi:hypothetical protein